MAKSTKAEEKILAQIDTYLAFCREPPPIIHVYQKQAAAVRASRKRHKGTKHTAEYLKFSHYRGIPITIIFEEISND